MHHVAAFYRFTPFADPAALRAPLIARCAAAGVRGTVILAAEGLNGTLAGPEDGMAEVIGHLRALPGCNGLAPKWSRAAAAPFGALKVRVKREIVTMGRAGLDPTRTGRRIAPAEWNAVIADPGTVTIDTRNAYEVAIGSFAGAVDPGTASFRDFPAWWRANRERMAGRRVAMFCTGGIRCEKATAFLREEGVADVVHLEGGILRYLETVPEHGSLWRGGCFVFDERVAVGHGLRATGHVLCRACRRPLTPAETRRPEYEEGVACHRCAEEYGATDRARFRERMRQMRLAETRGERHLG